jgi:hypothetical protein
MSDEEVNRDLGIGQRSTRVGGRPVERQLMLWAKPSRRGSKTAGFAQRRTRPEGELTW